MWGKMSAVAGLVAALALLTLTGAAAASSADPSSVDFGQVPLNTTATKSVTLTVDSGYQVLGASGASALNPPFAFAFDQCANGGSFTGPGTCTIKESFTPTTTGTASADLTIITCPTGGGSCIDIPVHFDAAGVNVLAITTASLPSGTFGSAYPPATIQTAGGTPPNSFAVTSGSLPPGLVLDASTGTLSGTPTAAGTFTFTVTATDSGAPTPQTASKTYTIAITGVADLAAAVAGPGSPAQHAKPVTFTVSARNLGPTSATGVSLTDTLPSGSGFVSLTTSQGTCTAPPVGATGTIVCSLGDLAAGATATVAVVVQPTGKKTTITDTASVAPGTATIDPVAANNSASADVQIK